MLLLILIITNVLYVLKKYGESFNISLQELLYDFSLKKEQ